MRSFFGLLGAIAAFGLAFGPTSAFAADPPDPVKIYKKCKGCHGADGKGQTKSGKKFEAPDFTDAKWQERHDLAEITKAITEGKEGTKMRPFNKRLSADEIKIVAQYVKDFGKKK